MPEQNPEPTALIPSAKDIAKEVGSWIDHNLKP